MVDVDVEVIWKMSNLKKKRVKAKEQDPLERGKNFKEVSLGYGEKEAIEEANRCLGCKNPRCVEDVLFL